MSEVAGRCLFRKVPVSWKSRKVEKVFFWEVYQVLNRLKVLILGGGIVGSNAAQMAAGMGADVTITDINLARLRFLSETLPKNVKTLWRIRNSRIRKELPDVDLVVGSVLIPRR